MTYLLDTDILSSLIRRIPPSGLLAKLAVVPRTEQSTSSITCGELYYGAHRRSGDVRDRLLLRLENEILMNLLIFSFDLAAARAYAEIRADLEYRGTPIGESDMRIAAIALARGLTVVTGNVRHFGRIPNLQVENWLQ